MDQLKKIVASIHKEFPGKRASKQKAANIIVTYVNNSHEEMDESGEICPHYQPQLRIKWKISKYDEQFAW